MDLKIYPSNLKGLVEAPPSKSLTHRALICASFSKGKSTIVNPLICEDTTATIKILKSIGVCITFYENKIIVEGKSIFCSEIQCYDAKSSATTLRLLLPLLSTFLDHFCIQGSERLIERVFTEDLLDLSGLDIKAQNQTLKVKGNLNKTIYNLSGKKTAQLINGMILALPFFNPNTVLHLRDVEISNPYIQMTIYIAEKFGLKFNIDYSLQTISLKEGANYQPGEISIEGDYSNGANWLAASYLNPEVSVTELLPQSIQGDIAFFDHLKKMKVEYSFLNDEFKYIDGKISKTEIDVTQTPDLVPILVCLASLGSDTVIISGISKLHYKESNRIEAIIDGINRLGGNVKVIDGKIIIKGQETLLGGCEVEGYNDHRIVMALTIISSKCENPYVIKDFRAVNKSYPNFFDEFQKLGGRVEVI